METYKDYLGDAVYADFDGYHIVLTTEDGVSISNTIYLDDRVLAALDRYRKRLAKMLEAERATADG